MYALSLLSSVNTYAIDYEDQGHLLLQNHSAMQGLYARVTLQEREKLTESLLNKALQF